MNTITRERVNGIARGEKCYTHDDVVELARIALASLEAEPVAYIRDGFRADGVHFCGGIISAEEHERTKPALSERYNWKHQPLYTAAPVSAFEIKDLEHFISFWKKVQAGQMKPGKNDIDHMVWFLEGLSNLTTPPAPVVPGAWEQWIADVVEYLEGGLEAEGELEAEGSIEAKRLLSRRAAMLQGADRPQSAQQNIPEIIPGGLVEAVNNLLNNDGSRGRYSAIGCGEAREKIELWLAQRQKWESQRSENLCAGNSPVIPDWQAKAEKLAELHGSSFVVFRNGESPQCADPSKVVISFTGEGLGHGAPAPLKEVKQCT